MLAPEFDVGDGMFKSEERTTVEYYADPRTNPYAWDEKRDSFARAIVGTPCKTWSQGSYSGAIGAPSSGHYYDDYYDLEEAMACAKMVMLKEYGPRPGGNK